MEPVGRAFVRFKDELGDVERDEKIVLESSLVFHILIFLCESCFPERAQVKSKLKYLDLHFLMLQNALQKVIV